MKSDDGQPEKSPWNSQLTAIFSVRRYQLLLRDLVRHTEKGLDILSKKSCSGDVAGNSDKLKSSLQEEVETLSRALHIMTVVPKMANDMMMVGRLQGFDVSFHLPFVPISLLGCSPIWRFCVFCFFWVRCGDDRAKSRPKASYCSTASSTVVQI